jgi:hypothetical protein
MKHRRVPSKASDPIAALTSRLQPASLLADVQRVWPQAAGDLVAAQATPTSARAGEVVVTCSSAVWAQELELIGPDVVERLNGLLGAGTVVRLRCRAAPTRGWARK